MPAIKASIKYAQNFLTSMVKIKNVDLKRKKLNSFAEHMIVYIENLI